MKTLVTKKKLSEKKSAKYRDFLSKVKEKQKTGKASPATPPAAVAQASEVTVSPSAEIIDVDRAAPVGKGKEGKKGKGKSKSKDDKGKGPKGKGKKGKKGD